MEMSKITEVVKRDAASVGRNMFDLTASSIVFYTAASGGTSKVNRNRLAKIIDDAGVPEGTRKYVLNLVHKGFDKWKGAVVLDTTPAEARTALADAMRQEYGTLDAMRKSFLPGGKGDAEDQEVAGQGAATTEETAKVVADNGTKVVNFVTAHIADLTAEQLSQVAALVSNRMAELGVGLEQRTGTEG